MSRRQLGSLAFVVVAAIYFSSYPGADNDLWGHVLFGQRILADGALAKTNGYSYTAPDYPWINHEILAECAFAAVFDRLGSPGLLLLKIALGLAAVLLVTRTAARKVSEPLAWALAAGLSASVMSWGILVRPQLFSLVGLALVSDRIHAHAETGRSSALAILPPCFVLWINTHGGVLAGWSVLAAYVAAAGLQSERSERVHLFLWLAAASIALLANPYGVRLIVFLLNDVSLSRNISEWQPVGWFDGSQPLFKLAVLVCIVGAFVAHDSPAWEKVIVALAAIVAFRHQRHLPLFAIVAAPLVARTFGTAFRWLASRPDPTAWRLCRTMSAAALLVVAAWQIWQVGSIYAAFGGRIYVSPELFPTHAVRFISQNDLRGNLLLPFDWGEYALWHLHARCRVSVDGRYTTAYPVDVLEQADRFLTGAAGWERSLADASIVLLDRRQPIVDRMFREPSWQYVYSDATALVFVRKEAAETRRWERTVRDGDRLVYFP